MLAGVVATTTGGGGTIWIGGTTATIWVALFFRLRWPGSPLGADLWVTFGGGVGDGVGDGFGGIRFIATSACVTCSTRPACNPNASIAPIPPTMAIEARAEAVLFCCAAYIVAARTGSAAITRGNG